MQTDDTLLLANNEFALREQQEIKNARIISKPQDVLTHQQPLKFNSSLISESAQRVILSQERTCATIHIVQQHNADTTSSRNKIRKNITPAEQYVAQRALSAYITSISQPEASFNLSYATQAMNPIEDDIKTLNKRLE